MMNEQSINARRLLRRTADLVSSPLVESSPHHHRRITTHQTWFPRGVYDSFSFLVRDVTHPIQFLAVLEQQLNELNEGKCLTATELREMADELQRVRAMLPQIPSRVYGDDVYKFGDNNGDDGAGAIVNEGRHGGGRSSPLFTPGRSRPSTPRSASGTMLDSPGDELRRRTRNNSVPVDGRRSPGLGKAQQAAAAAAAATAPPPPTADRSHRNTPSGRDRTALLGSAKAHPRSSRSAATQEALTEDLAAMAKQLRELSTVEGERLKADVALGEVLNDAADRNTENLAKAELSLKEQIANSGGCGIWMLLIFTLISFFGAIFVIKLTNR